MSSRKGKRKHKWHSCCLIKIKQLARKRLGLWEMRKNRRKIFAQLHLTLNLTLFILHSLMYLANMSHFSSVNSKDGGAQQLSQTALPLAHFSSILQLLPHMTYVHKLPMNTQCNLVWVVKWGSFLLFVSKEKLVGFTSTYEISAVCSNLANCAFILFYLQHNCCNQLSGLTIKAVAYLLSHTAISQSISLFFQTQT